MAGTELLLGQEIVDVEPLPPQRMVYTVVTGDGRREEINMARPATEEDIFNTFAGLEEARHTATSPENESFVQGIEEGIKEASRDLRRAIALDMLNPLVTRYGDLLTEATGSGDLDTLRGLEGIDVDDTTDPITVTSTGLFERLSEEWLEGSPPETLLNIARDVLDVDGEQARRWAEWTGTHVMYWAARDLDRELKSRGRDPMGMEDKEWDALFEKFLAEGDYFADAIQILANELSSIAVEQLDAVLEKEDLSLGGIEALLGIAGEAAGLRLPEPSPNPFAIDTGLARLPADPVTQNHMEAMAGTPSGRWVEDSMGRPVFKYTLRGKPWTGSGQLSVKSAIETQTAWKILDAPSVDAAVLYALFSTYAWDTPPEKRPNGEFRIPRQVVFRTLGLPHNWSVREKTQHVYKLNQYLNSFQVQLKRVAYNGNQRRTTEISPAQLWDTYLVGVEEADLMGNVQQLDFMIRGREGAWANLFMHGDHDWKPWGYLPLHVLEDIDRRNEFPRRILLHLVWLFRVSKGGFTRKAETLLQWCHVDLDSLNRQTKHRRKRRLLNALSELKAQGFKIEDERLRISGMYLEDWRAQRVHFHPPDDMANASGYIGGDASKQISAGETEVWTGKRIRQLRKHIGDVRGERENQGRFGQRLPNRAGSMGVKQSRVSLMEKGTHPPTDAQERALDDLAERFGFDG